MLTQQEITKKIYDLADQFESMYRNKQYKRAKHIYDTARNVAVFVELPESDMFELFYNHNPDESKDAIPEWGRFNMDHVQKCYYEEAVRYGKPDPPGPFIRPQRT